MRLEGVFRVRLLGLLFGEVIAYVILILANGAVFFHYFQSIPEPFIPLLVARTLGHLLCLNFSILTALPQKNSIWVPIFGVSIERMIKYHRIMGRILFTVMSTHLILFWYYWISKGYFLSAPPNKTYSLMITSIIGNSAWICVFVILITSLEFVRRSRFELFYYTHHLFLVVVGLATYHTYLTQRFAEDLLLYWLIPGITMYVCDKIIRAWRAKGQTRLISVVRDEGTNIILLKLKRINFKYEPGQFIYLNIPQISYLQWHPFSITSAPSESQTRDTIVSLAIRDMGKTTWTNSFHKLIEETLLPENIKVRIDGPYGKLSIDLYNYPVLVLIAGGIGISPLISILSEYHNNPSLSFDKLYFTWCAKHQDYLAPFAYMLQDIEANDMLGKLEIHKYATRDLESARRPHNEGSQRGLIMNGHMPSSIEHLFTPGRPVLRDFFSRLIARHPNSRIGVVVCGPTVMADDVADTCALFNKFHAPQIDLHRENFAF